MIEDMNRLMELVTIESMTLTVPTNEACTISGGNLNVIGGSVPGALAYRFHVYKNTDAAACPGISSGFVQYIKTTNSLSIPILSTDLPVCVHVRACSTVSCSSYGPLTSVSCTGGGPECNPAPVCNLVVS